jgi:hypothetical protein
MPTYGYYRVVQRSLTTGGVSPLTTSVLQKGLELGHSHWVTSDIVPRQGVRMLGRFSTKCLGIPFFVAPHPKRPGWDLNKSQHKFVREMPGIDVETRIAYGC